jgi:hypothetical protein
MPPKRQEESIIPDLRTWDVPKYLARDGIYLLLGDRGTTHFSC